MAAYSGQVHYGGTREKQRTGHSTYGNGELRKLVDPNLDQGNAVTEGLGEHSYDVLHYSFSGFVTRCQSSRKLVVISNIDLSLRSRLWSSAALRGL